MILLDRNGNPPKSFDKRLERIEAILNDLIPAHNANTAVIGALMKWIEENTKQENEDVEETAE